MKRITSLQDKSVSFTRRSVILPKDTMERFEAVCNELDLETDELLEITIERFLSSKVWEDVRIQQALKKPCC